MAGQHTDSRMLVVGASGFVGRHLLAAARVSGYSAIGTQASSRRAELVVYDLLEHRLRDVLPPSFLAGDGPRWACICAGITNMEACGRDPQASRQVNVTCMQRLVDELVELGFRVLYFSSSAVFEGQLPLHDEATPTAPVNEYGRQKVEMERYVLSHAPKSLVIRISKAIGTDPAERHLFSEWVGCQQQGLPIEFIAGESFSPTDVDDIAAACLRLIELDASGVFHVANPESLSRDELARRFMDSWGHEIAMHPRPPEHFGFTDGRPMCSCLSIKKLVQATDFRFRSVAQLARAFCANLRERRTCQLCRSADLSQILDLGQQPICNRFLRSATEQETLFPLTLVQCRVCGLAQLGRFPPASELTPPYAWLSYHEPEGHLDSLADAIANLPGLAKDAVAWGLTFKDDTLLQRLEARGACRTHRLDPAVDLGVTDANAGVEIIQDKFRTGNTSVLLAGRERPQLIIARHILEHAHDQREFLGSLRDLLAPGGYLIAEVPDCEPAFRQLEYTTLWEEHVSYFAAATFRQALAAAGLQVRSLLEYPNRHERLLVAIASANSSSEPANLQAPTRELDLLRAFGENLSRQRQRFVDALDGYRRRGETVAILGAGHLACAFVQYLMLKDYIAMIIDDNPRKQGTFMPGSRLPIRGSSALLEGDVRLCLLSVNPEVEDKVIQRNHVFRERGGRFASIFMASERALLDGAE